MKSFRARLRAVLSGGNLTIADVARWVERPHPTVRGWVNGTAVGLTALDHAFVLARLEQLEKLVKRGVDLPVPRMSWAKRKAYMADLHNKVFGGKKNVAHDSNAALSDLSR